MFKQSDELCSEIYAYECEIELRESMMRAEVDYSAFEIWIPTDEEMIEMAALAEAA